MYSGVTKIYCRKTVRHVFTKPVQIEGTTERQVVFSKSNENFKTAIPSKNYDRPKATRECGIF